jgi:hypothetical protein
MEQKIIGNIKKIDSAKRKLPFFVVLFGFLVFMPLGFLLMWFDKTYHRYLRIFLIIFGFILIFLSGYFLITINKLSVFYGDFNVQQPTVFPYAIIFFLALLGIIQIVIGFFFKRLPNIKNAVASILLILSSLTFYIWIGTLVSSVVIPLYNLSNTVNNPIISEIANWKTYNNSKYGFSFKYPESYNFSSSGPNFAQQQIDSGKQISGTVAPSFDTLAFTGSNKDHSFTVGIFGSIFQGDALRQGFDGSCGTQFADKTLIDKTDLLNGIKYREVEQQDHLGINIHYCFLSGTNIFLSLSAFSVNKDNIDKASQFLQQILSTFKFSNTIVYGTTKEAIVIIQDAKRFWPTLGDGYYQLEISSYFHLFGKGNGFDLGKYLGKKIKVSYREEIGHTEGEQQIVLVDSIIPDITNWKTYTNPTYNYTFKYPLDWSLKSPNTLGNQTYTFSYQSIPNLNSKNNKPYRDLYEFIDLPYKVNETIVDGQKAVQPLPRAGSENIFEAFFFTPQSKYIISFSLETPKDGSKFDEGQTIYNQILASFKFL